MTQAQVEKTVDPKRLAAILRNMADKIEQGLNAECITIQEMRTYGGDKAWLDPQGCAQINLNDATGHMAMVLKLPNDTPGAYDAQPSCDLWLIRELLAIANVKPDQIWPGSML